MNTNKNFHSNIILIAGSGQNVGKSFLGEHLIKLIKGQHSITSLKISSHFYPPTDGLQLIKECESYRLFKESVSSSKKDSQRYLQAGATHSYYAEVKKEAMQQFINELHLNIDILEILLVESATFGNFIQPTIAFYIDGEDGNPCRWTFPFHLLKSRNSKIVNLPSQLEFIDHKWHITK